MSLLYPSTATASVAANTNAVSISGMDLTTVYPGMTISFGARDRKTGDQWIIGAVTLNGTSGGTLTLIGSPSSAYTNAAFVVDTLGYLGTDASYAASTNLALLQTLLTLFGPNTNLLSGAKKLALDKSASTALSSLLFSTAGRSWGDLVHRPLAYTPTGGTQVSAAETLSLRAYPDGATPTDAMLIDLATGGCDVRKAAVSMAAATTVDLSSAPFAKVLLTGGTGITIASFGAGKHYERRVTVIDGGATITHSAAGTVGTINCPGQASILTRAGDMFDVTSSGAGAWRIHNYTRGDGTPLALPSTATPAGMRPSFRQRLINASMAVNQRGTSSASTSYAAGAFVFDRWMAGSGGCTCSWSTAASGDVTVTITAGTLVQVMEGAPYLAEGGTYVLSWTGTAQGRAYQGTPASATSPAYAASPVVVTGWTAGTNGRTEFGTGTLTLPQFEPGSVVTPTERRDDELRRCQLYSRPAGFVDGVFVSTTRWVGTLAIIPPMRATPTLSLNRTSNALNEYTNGVLRDGTSLVQGLYSPYGGLILLNTATANNGARANVTNPDVFWLTAEVA